ncbi:hypothetical protein GCM10011351_12290 [Paraliobacillus quinghaiensis]|uniref:VanZ-like domain-containing protein n=1 Tax=Paraliobacillus quinghaiensis TaxID=470815 RepID=A0A917TLS5_9BACI|nr:VanZ family protein [Paraliobacillus quinghaiensis]GGM27936.1 hypothetical protein GCM10011351_12290 [Paraliobacillus quinghaiensis]
MLGTVLEVSIIVGLPVTLLYIIIKFFTRSFQPVKKELVNIMMLLYTVDLIFLVWLDPSEVLVKQSYNYIPFQTISLYVNQLIEGFIPLRVIVINLLGNVVVTVPIGLWFGYKRIKVKRAMMFATAVPVVMEVGQFIFHEIGYVSRTVDIDDWILNFVGILFGYFIFKCVEKVVDR